MNKLGYLRPKSITEVSQCLASLPDAQLLAGGQSLLAAWRLGLCKPTHFLDLQDVPELKDIRTEGDKLWVGAMCTHAQIANNALIASQIPMLSALARGIADAQIRNVGTIGGSLANNDPAACWPAGVLAMHADIVTNQRVINSDTFFQGIFTTALQRGEWILGLRFPRVAWAQYLKFEQAASRFALVGVAVTRSMRGHVRVAVTGLGQGVTRWHDAETALNQAWHVQALNKLAFEAANAQSDIHASALYRAHLVSVLCRRSVASATGESAVMPKSTQIAHASEMQSPARIQGSHMLHAPPEQVWYQLLDPAVLQRCIPGCTVITKTHLNHYQAIVKIGLGPVSANFATHVALFPEASQDAAFPTRCRLVLSGQAGALGEGKATVLVQLHAIKDPQTQSLHTRLDWQANPEVTGKLAQLGNRFMNATAHSLSQQFFNRFSAGLSGKTHRRVSTFFTFGLTVKVKQLFQRFFER